MGQENEKDGGGEEKGGWGSHLGHITCSPRLSWVPLLTDLLDLPADRLN